MSVIMNVVAAYNAAADHYDDPANSYWDRVSRRMLEHLGPGEGARLLDAGCGSGAFAIPAAEIVGPSGEVMGVDLAGELLALARRKAATRGLRQVVFEQSDYLDLPTDAFGFDGVVSIFSLFFASDMIGAVRHWWNLLLPGGTLVIATWGPGVFEPAAGAFWRSVGRCRPDLLPTMNPWDRVSHPGVLRTLIRSAGVSGVQVVTERGEHPLSEPEDWWRIVLGSGFRATVDALTPRERTFVHDESLDFLCGADVKALRVDTVSAICRKRTVRK